MRNTIPTARPTIGYEELKAIKRIIRGYWIGLGEEVLRFEERLKKFFNMRNAVAVNSGTSALHLTLDSFGIKNGDEVIVPSLTNPSPVQAILHCNATPVFCDIETNTINLGIDDLRRKVTDKTKAIIPVHYNGIPSKIEEINEITKSKDIVVIEDAAHAFGATYNGKKLGTFGDASCFSFDPIKNISCLDGGVVLTNDDKIAELMRLKRGLGVTSTWDRYKGKKELVYDISTHGYRYQMSNINAAVGLVQLDKFDSFIKRKKEIVERYNESFKEIDGINFLDIDYENTPPFLYIIKVKKNRDDLMKFLGEKGIQTRVHFIPCHFHSLFKGYASDLPNTEKVWEELLTLPLYYGMSDEDVARVISGVTEWFKK